MHSLMAYKHCSPISVQKKVCGGVRQTSANAAKSSMHELLDYMHRQATASRYPDEKLFAAIKFRTGELNDTVQSCMPSESRTMCIRTTAELYCLACTFWLALCEARVVICIFCFILLG